MDGTQIKSQIKYSNKIKYQRFLSHGKQCMEEGFTSTMDIFPEKYIDPEMRFLTNDFTENENNLKESEKVKILNREESKSTEIVKTTMYLRLLL